jgi:3-deoxy-D-manno-octulosonate 8-phosphate phosphatase KdsC-like HAD superfamily phosphatase
MDTLVERANDVRLLVLDVDGVLTDGRCISHRAARS